MSVPTRQYRRVLLAEKFLLITGTLLLGFAVLLIFAAGTARAHDGFLEFQNDPVNGTNCCGKDDCPIVAFDDLVPVPGGYLYKPTGEVVENRRAQFHPDGQPRVCQWKFGPKGVEHDPTGPIKCLFVAGGGV